jgi:hypothetical protein
VGAVQTAARTADAAETQLGAVATSAQRVVLTAVGAIATAGDTVKRNVKTFTDRGQLSRQLDRFERRGTRLLKQGRRQVRRRAR